MSFLTRAFLAATVFFAALAVMRATLATLDPAAAELHMLEAIADILFALLALKAYEVLR